LAIHLAETTLERELLLSQQGAMRAFLEEMGAWEPTGLAGSLEWFMHQAQRTEPVALVHGNYLDASKVAALGSGSRAHVVYCPRTHAFFGHPPHPFLDLQQAGVNVALGTDSLASNPDLSILEEMRFLWRSRPETPGETLLRMATLSGAAALGWDQETGSLTPGKSADFVVVPLERESANPYEDLFGSSRPVASVWIRGRKQ
jgi:cytosine/adenosine deaminase-related metal-dependent hydrolase